MKLIDADELQTAVGIIECNDEIEIEFLEDGGRIKSLLIEEFRKLISDSKKIDTREFLREHGKWN